MSKKLGLLILWLFLCFCIGCAINPITGEEQLMLISQQQDIAIGQKYAPEVEKQLSGRIANERLQHYIDNVGQRIARVSHRPDLEYHFVALEDESINALTLPGGYVFVTKGMLKKLTTEAQLASILAHEIAHVAARHASAAMSREIGIDILLSAVTSERTPQNVLTTADMTRQILGLQYSKKDEEEADLAGLDYTVWSGYNPHGMVETIQMLQRQQQARPIEFLSTHPAPQSRIAYLTQRIQTKYHSLAGSKVGQEDYHSAVLKQLKNR